MSVLMMGVMAALALIVGGVVDYASLVAEKQEVQAAADAAALAAARELTFAQDAVANIQPVAEASVRANLLYGAPQTVAQMIDNKSAVQVTVSANPRVFFPGPIGQNAKTITATAVAEVRGGSVCMIGLSPKAKSTLNLKKKSGILAERCAIYSNSTAKEGITVEDDAQVTAAFICSAGGIKAKSKSQIAPDPVTDCPPLDDPLIGRPEPTGSSVCTFSNFTVAAKTSATLSPGTYCGGLKIEGSATLGSGIYIIRDGQLSVDKGGVLIGQHVGFFLTGTNALVNFEKDSTIELTAPATGALAGLLLFESRKVIAADGGVADADIPPDPVKVQEHRIRSNNARKLVGTIYLSRNRLLIDGDKPIADKSEYTVILAREFALADGPVVVLNSQYALTDVPVPAGVGNRAAAKTRLIH